jgi:hypothetical protein
MIRGELGWELERGLEWEYRIGNGKRIGNKKRGQIRDKRRGQIRNKEGGIAGNGVRGEALSMGRSKVRSLHQRLKWEVWRGLGEGSRNQKGGYGVGGERNGNQRWEMEMGWQESEGV